MTHLPYPGTVMAVHEPALSEYLRQIRDSIRAGDRVEAATPRRSMAEQRGAVRVIPIRGLLSQKEDWVSRIMGWATYEGIVADVEDAMNDDDVGAIVFDVDSPGGYHSGVTDAAEKIFSARGVKPMIAVANPLAASAAYWVASAADEFHMTATAEVGSIGTVIIHEEISGMLENEGITVNIIRSTPRKFEGNSAEPLSDTARESFQEKVDYAYGMFAKAVAKHRGIPVADLRKSYGDGSVFDAKNAVSIGVVDGIASLDQVIKKHNSGRSRRNASRSARARMSMLSQKISLDD